MIENQVNVLLYHQVGRCQIANAEGIEQLVFIYWNALLLESCFYLISVSPKKDYLKPTDSSTFWFAKKFLYQLIQRQFWQMS